MKIDFYCVGICRDDGKPTQLAGCGIVIVFTDDQNKTKFRSSKYGLGNSTQNLADLQTVRLALASVKSSFRGVESTIIHTSSPHAAKMLEREGKAFVAGISENTHVVDEIRKWFGFYSNISIIVENPNDDNMIQAKDFADIALVTQEHSDSGTLDSFNIDA